MWAVGFGGLSDGGGLVLGLSFGGPRGSGVSMVRGCFAEGVVAGPFRGGEAGAIACGKGKVGMDIDDGDGGGDGVVEVERKVGPRGVDSADKGESGVKPENVRSIG